MIHVENDWYVDVDKYCYILAKYNGTRLDKDGKEVEVWTDQKYYATLKKALAGYFKIKTKDGHLYFNADPEAIDYAKDGIYVDDKLNKTN